MKEKLDSLCDLHIHSNFSDSDMDLERDRKSVV